MRPSEPEAQTEPGDKAALRHLLKEAEWWAQLAATEGDRARRRQRVLVFIRAAEALANVSGHINKTTWARLRNLRRALTGESE